MTRWRKMKTAPTDGTPILATNGTTVTTVYPRESKWRLVETGDYADYDEYAPVAWMPCPKPPRVR